jgi:hypothetical protein
MPANILNDAEQVLYCSEDAPWVFQNLAQMRGFPQRNNANWIKGQGIAYLLGATTAFDALGAWYAWDPASTAADNGGTVIQPTKIAVDAVLNPTGAGRWRKGT